MNTSFDTKKKVLSAVSSSSASLLLFVLPTHFWQICSKFQRNRDVLNKHLHFCRPKKSLRATFPSLATYVAIYWINCAKRPSRLIIKHATNELRIVWRVPSARSSREEGEEKLESDFKYDDV